MKVKVELNQEFEIKDLGASTRILGIDIKRYRNHSKLCLSQESYIRKIIDKFGMSNSKPVITPTTKQFKLSITQSFSARDERAFMDITPYANILGFFMYTKVCTRSDITYTVSLVSRYMVNPEKSSLASLEMDPKIHKMIREQGPNL